MDAARRWELRRNCALTPRQLFGGGLALCATVVALGALFWMLGYPFVIAFALLEVAGLLAALVAHARCACDRDVVELRDGRLVVVQCHAGCERRTELDATWARVLEAARSDSAFTLSSRGVALQLGRHATPAERRRVVAELRSALAAPSSWE